MKIDATNFSRPLGSLTNCEPVNLDELRWDWNQGDVQTDTLKYPGLIIGNLELSTGYIIIVSLDVRFVTYWIELVVSSLSSSMLPHQVKMQYLQI